VLSVVLAVALLALAASSLWQGVGGREPISVGYTEPFATAGVAPEPTATATAAPAPAPSAAPRAPVRPRPKAPDVYDEVDREKRR
jgi:hypothetical protein